LLLGLTHGEDRDVLPYIINDDTGNHKGYPYDRICGRPFTIKTVMQNARKPAICCESAYSTVWRNYISREKNPACRNLPKT
jgi:hypothetical protein